MSKVYSNIRLFSQTIGRAAACLVALVIFTTAASAATYTVDTTADNATLTACTTGAANDCSLRGAIARANATFDNDTIDFALPAGINTITLTGGQLITGREATFDSLTIINSTGASNLLISGNDTSRVFEVSGGTGLTLNGVTVTSGNTGGSGGGIINYGGTTLLNSTVSGNRAGFRGGGIFNSGDITLLNSTVSGNTAQNEAGGIYNGGVSTTLTNSTVSGNTGSTGGGIYNNVGVNGGTLNLTCVTVAFNTSTSNIAGGVYNTVNGTANLRNTIVAKNTASDGPDFYGAISSASPFNLIGDGTQMTGITNADANSNQVGTAANPIDPKLNPALALNGGTTLNHALLAGSPAYDKGNATGTDQRGLTRPSDNPAVINAIGGNGADIGAFEAQVTGGSAATYTVDTPADDAALTACTPGAANDCSLRGAIAAASATSENDTINFALPAGVNTITLTGGALTINGATAGPLTITNSTGASNLLISGNDLSRVFVVNLGTNLTLNGVTVTRGNAGSNGGGILNNGTLSLLNSTVSGNTSAGRGGGVYNFRGTLTLTNSTVSGNTAQSGGGISNSGGTTTLLNSTVSGNRGTSDGGGIYNASFTSANMSTLSLTNSTVSGNEAFVAGGIHNDTDTTMTLSNSTVNGNTSEEGGGGIFNTGTLSLLNSTVSGNTARVFEFGQGGGILNGGTLNLTSVTVAFNTAQDAGGGVYTDATAPAVNLSNTIIAKNSGAPSAPDFLGPISQASSFNLIGNGTGTSGITNGDANGNQVGTSTNPIDPNLGSLALNRGTTPNHALLSGSPAIDKGNATGTDQRGLTRPIDNPSIANATNGNGADIGAFEVQLAPTAASVSVSGRVSTPLGRGLTNATVTMTDASGNVRTVRTGTFGYFRFDGVEAGQTHVFNVNSKRFTFVPQVVSVMENLTDLNFTAQ